MPGALVDVSTTMTCPHGAPVTLTPVGPPVVQVNGKQVLAAGDQLVVTGCAALTPCTTVQWNNLGHVLVNGRAALLQNPPAPPGPANGICTGGAPLVVQTQPFVTGT